ncbi:MAG TPA: TIGR02391 family protein [Pyrinomonadaceae bacterium]|nr:TIGR02391 family protein [Pyrinomonadaceae bacterium]
MPDPQILMALEPEELAGVLIEEFNKMSLQQLNQLHRDNLMNDISRDDGFPLSLRQDIAGAAMEAWTWLEREGLVIPRPGSTGSIISRRGKQIKDKSALQAYRRANLLPKEILHPLVIQKVSAAFLRGEYDTAVFIAFREVEVAVREAGAFSANDFGVALMEEAFKPSVGALTDSSETEPEQLALRKLYAGAIGYYKNPGSHQNVAIDPAEAVELICFASRLMKIVDDRKT